MKPHTVWVNPSQREEKIKEVPIPQEPAKGKGNSKYARECEKLLKFNTALEMHEDDFGPFRRGLWRYLRFRQVHEKSKIRQRLNTKTRFVTVWLEKK